jgi:hypothetical protein
MHDCERSCPSRTHWSCVYTQWLVLDHHLSPKVFKPLNPRPSSNGILHTTRNLSRRRFAPQLSSRLPPHARTTAAVTNSAITPFWTIRSSKRMPRRRVRKYPELFSGMWGGKTYSVGGRSREPICEGGLVRNRLRPELAPVVLTLAVAELRLRPTNG